MHRKQRCVIVRIYIVMRGG